MIQQASDSKKPKFTREEDRLIIQGVMKYGICNWKSIAKEMRTRNSRQCQERWENYLNHSINTNQ
jgi:hypothetical protein